MEYNSQGACKQDARVDEFLKHKENGIFIDIGCNHYKSGNNTYFFEKNRNWKGICIDPIDYSQSYQEHRPNSIFVHGALTNYKNLENIEIRQAGVLSSVSSLCCERHKKRCEIENFNVEKTIVPNLDFNKILEKYNTPRNIDYVSIDTEGAELEIIKSIDFKKWNISLFTIEFNGADYWNPHEMHNIMKKNGYKFGQTGFDFVYYK